MNSITIRLNRETKGIDQAPSGDEWVYTVLVDSSYGPYPEPFKSLEAALSSVGKYLKQRQIEEKQNLRGPN